jgi:hypothetical protein
LENPAFLPAKLEKEPMLNRENSNPGGEDDGCDDLPGSHKHHPHVSAQD